MKILSLFSVILFCHISFADDPDLSRETRLHKIFEIYNEKPTPDNSWKAALSHSKNESYQVQAGDTLWNLSETLFGDPAFWPKLWSVNNASGLENPHEIVPGQVVVFTPGTTADAPKVSVAKSAADVGVISQPDEATLEKENSLLNQVKLPDSAKKYAQGIEVPDSLPTWSFNRKNSATVESYEFLPRRVYASSKQEIIPQLITEERPESAGAVTETELGVQSAGEFQYIYVTLNPGEAKNFFVIKEIGSVTDPETGKKAIVSQIQGEIEVLQKVNDEKNLYRALVTRCVNPIGVGSQLLKGSAPRYDTTLSDLKVSGNSVQGQIINGDVTYENRIAATSSFMYFNVGSDKTVTVGQVLPIYKKNISLNSATQVKENRLKIGQVVIVQVTNHFSVGMIADSSEELKVGDLTY